MEISQPKSAEVDVMSTLPADDNNFVNIWQRIPSQIKFILEYTTFTILGNYARIAITALSEYKYAYTTPGTILWSNFAACILMGVMQVLNEEKWFVNHPELFISVATGCAGSFSSYSSMMLEVFEHSTSLTNSNVADHTKLPNRAYGIMEFLSVILSQLFISMAALVFGRKLASEIIVPFCSQTEADDNSEGTMADNNGKMGLISRRPKAFIEKTVSILAYAAFALAIPFIALLITLAGVYGNYSRGEWTLPPLFGICGSFARFYISKFLNPKNPKFPIGTFCTNQLSVAIIAVLTLVLRGRKGYNESSPIVNDVNACHVVSGLVSGYCGSMSTVSTFINEGYKLNFLMMVRYVSISVAVSYCLFVIILGSFSWSRGLTNPVC